MIRIHPTAQAARTALLEAGFWPLAENTRALAQRWARPGALSDTRVICREVVGADERWSIQRSDER